MILTDKEYNYDYRSYKEPSRVKKPRNKLKNLFLIVFICSLSFVILLRYSIIYQKSVLLNKMETKLAYTENLNRQLEVEIATLSDMKKIESIAKDKFGMIEPERGQRVYLNVGSDKKNDVHMTNKNENKSIFSKILGLVVK